MMGQNKRFAMREAWERASSVYLARRGEDVATVSYGNLAPTDDELGLLGDVAGKRVLDFGCGGGHNAIACAQAGAKVMGVDISDTQIDAAQRLATHHQVKVEWRVGDDGALGQWQDASFDIVLAIQSLQYLDDLQTFFRQARRLLCSGGRLVVSTDHPIRNCFYDAEMEELSAYPLRSYDDFSRLQWHFDEGLPMQAAHVPLGQWVDWVIGAGMTLQRVIEARAPSDARDDLWPEDSPLAPLRNIPHTLILVASVT